MIADFLLVILTLAVTYFGATWIERDKRREREDALLDALDDAVSTIADLDRQMQAITRRAAARNLGVIDGGAS